VPKMIFFLPYAFYIIRLVHFSFLNLHGYNNKMHVSFQIDTQNAHLSKSWRSGA